MHTEHTIYNLLAIVLYVNISDKEIGKNTVDYAYVSTQELAMVFFLTRMSKRYRNIIF